MSFGTQLLGSLANWVRSEPVLLSKQEYNIVFFFVFFLQLTKDSTHIVSALDHCNPLPLKVFSLCASSPLQIIPNAAAHLDHNLSKFSAEVIPLASCCTGNKCKTGQASKGAALQYIIYALWFRTTVLHSNKGLQLQGTWHVLFWGLNMLVMQDLSASMPWLLSGPKHSIAALHSHLHPL